MHRVLDEPAVAAFEPALGRETMKCAVERVFDRARASKEERSDESLLKSVRRRARASSLAEPGAGRQRDRCDRSHESRPRAACAPKRWPRSPGSRSGYSNLEYDLQTGERGSRYARVGDVVRELTGAEDSAGRQQLRRRRAARPRHVRARARGHRRAQSTGRDRRRLSLARRARAQRCEARRGGHDQSRLHRGFRARALAAHGAAAAHASLELSNRRLRRTSPRRTRAGGARVAAPACRSSKISAAGRSSILSEYGVAARANRCRGAGRRRATGNVLRRQTARRSAGGHRRRHGRSDRAPARQSAAARAARR